MALNCTIGDINLPEKQKNIVNNVAEGDPIKKLILASYFTTGTFEEYLKSITDKKLNLDSDSNVLQGELKKLYILRSNKVKTTLSREAGSISEGFIETQDYIDAILYTSKLILEEYYDNLKNNAKSPKDIIFSVNELLEKQLRLRADNCAKDNKDIKLSKEYIAAKEIYENIKSIIENYRTELRDINDRLEKISEEHSDIKKDIALLEKFNNKDEANLKYKELKVLEKEYDIKEARKKELNSFLDYNNPDSQVNQYSEVTNNFYLATKNLLTERGTKQDKNFANLVSKIRSNTTEWYRMVFTNSMLTDVNRKFKQALDSLDDYDITKLDDIDDTNEDTDEDSSDGRIDTGWDREYKSYLRSVDGRIRLYLSRLPKLVSPTIDGEEDARDYNNGLGVNLNEDASFLINQIFSSADFSSLDTFVESIERLSKIKGLYSLATMAKDIKEDTDKALYFYTQFGKVLIKKFKAFINDDSINIKQTNYSIDGVTSRMYMMANSFIIAYKDFFDKNDIKFVQELLKDRNASTKIFEHYEEVRDKTINLLSRYIPKLSKDELINYLLNTNDNATKDDHLYRVLSITKSIITEANTLVNRQNEIIIYNNEIAKEFAKRRANNERVDDLEYQSLSKSEYSDIYEYLRVLAKYIADNNPSDTKLNSANSLGNQSSDTIAPCYITNVIDRIRNKILNDKNIPIGLDELRKFVTRGNFYDYSTIFFGIKGVKQGLFNSKNEVNPNAQELLDYFLFDGTINTLNSKGSIYKTMYKGDYFMNVLALFNKNKKTNENTNGPHLTNYFMRTPSDASKNYVITSQYIPINRLFLNNGKINPNHGLVKAFVNQLKGEINIFVTQVQKLHRNQNNVIDITDDAGLYDKAHLRRSKKGEITIIDENGQLVGNFFQFTKLFDVNGVNYNQIIKEALSLYGGENGVIIKKGKEYILNLNHPLFSKTKTNNDVISVDFSQFEEKLTEIVTDWLNNYIIESNKRTQQYDAINNELNEESRFTKSEMLECILNYALTYMEFDDLFEGSTKYYADPQEFLKRAKEAQMSGVIYNGGYIYEPIAQGLRNFKYNGSDVDIIVGNHNLGKMRNGWKAITIRNTLRSYDDAEGLRQTVLKYNIEQGVPENVANKIADKIISAFTSITKLNDAQSYITLDEWIRRRKADGTLNQYTELLTKLLDPTIEMTDIELQEAQERIQCDKNVYYDIDYDSINDVPFPRQIKNAEFVLIPKVLDQFTIDGKPCALRELYDIMKECDLGQVNTEETSKAAKKNILTYWENDLDSETGVTKYKSKEDFINEIKATPRAVETYYYSHLYRQQVVPQHMLDETNKIPVQLLTKIFDNIRTKLPSEYKAINDVYSSIIKQSAIEFFDECGWKINDEGEIVNKDGTPNLNLSVFYEKAKDEAIRLGLDSNTLEYFELGTDGLPKMPSFMSAYSTKVEQVFQSLFNNNITRQLTPGWHAAQITNVGFSRRLKYHPEVIKDSKVVREAYVEILLPRWSKLIPKDYDIKKLEEEGLDMHILHYMPIEGKTSIILAKVVGFLPDCCGSTVVIANELITQTGKDFDIDSAYGYYPEMYMDKDGVLRKVKYDESTTETGYLRRYINYVKYHTRDKLDKISSLNAEKQKIYESLKEQFEIANADFFTKNKALEKFYNTKNKRARELNKDLRERIKKFANAEKAKKKSFEQIRISIIENFGEELNKTEEGKKYINIITAMSDAIHKLHEQYEEKYEEQEGKIKEEQERIFNEFVKNIEISATQVGLLSFEEFKKLPIEDQNSIAAKRTKFIELLQSILKSSETLEEQLTVSGYDDLMAADKYVRGLLGIANNKRSSYNILDQIDYMDEVISGRQLKGFSANRDKFLSICNILGVKVSDNFAFKVLYNLDEKDGKNTLYDKDIITYSYGEQTKVITKNLIEVTHNQLGNSTTNRNIDGKLISTGSMQTSSHILDAVKVGPLLNENKFTFGVFKLFPDLGIDYYTALKWLYQPSISKIVEKSNQTNSVFLLYEGNPIFFALKDLLGMTKYDSTINIANVLTNNIELINTIKELYGFEINSKDIFDIPIIINNDLLTKRLLDYKNGINTIFDTAIDIVTMLQFGKLKTFINNIVEKTMRGCNPDKWGAKQSIDETQLTIDSINELREDKTLLTKNGQTIFNALYPVEGMNINPESSEIPYLASFLLFSSISSIKVNSQAFVLESPEFRNLYAEIAKEIYGKGGKFNHEIHSQLAKYLVGTLYSQISFLKLPLTVDKKGYIIIDESRNTEDGNAENAELLRIYGFNNTSLSSINYEKLMKQDEEEITKFNKLSPYQKVMFLQTNSNDAGLLNEIEIRPVENVNNEKGRFTLMRINDTIGTEIFIRQFRDLFFNKHPMYRLTAIDLIKYSFIAEGFKFGSGRLSKIIVNNALRNDIQDFGMNIVASANDAMSATNFNVSDIATKFVRSHSEIVPVISIPKPNDKHNEGNELASIFSKTSDSFFYLTIGNKSTSKLEEKITSCLYRKDFTLPLNFIRIRKNVYKKYKSQSYSVKETTLYKVEDCGDVIYFIPLNLLNENECSTVSINNYNNIHKSEEFYQSLLNEHYLSLDTNSGNKVDLKEEIRKEETEKREGSEKLTDSPDYFNFVMESTEQSILKGGITRLMEDINKYFELPIEERGKRLIVINPNYELAKLIKGKIMQEVILNDGSSVKITINHLNNAGIRTLTSNRYKPTKTEIVAINKARHDLANGIKADNINMYSIREYVEPDAKQEVEDMKSSIGIVTPEKEQLPDNPILPDTNTTDLNDQIRVIKQMYNNISRNAKQGDIYAENVMQQIRIKGIDFESATSIKVQMKNIYIIFANYYSKTASSLKNQIENFDIEDNDGTIYNFAINNPELYNVLNRTNNDKDKQRLMSLILNCLTFGDRFADILTLGIEGEDIETSNAINSIKQSIESIRNNEFVTSSNEARPGANELYIDKIFAKDSTNPFIQIGLVKLSEVFHDASWFELHIADAAETSNKMMQIVIKDAEQILNAATLRADKEVEEFRKEYERLSKLCDMSKVITPNGEYGKEYKEQVYEDYTNLLNKVEEARKTYGDNSIEYHKAKLEANKFKAENFEQEYVQSYYKEVNENVERILNLAPDSYIKYCSLMSELYTIRDGFDILSQQSRRRIIEINKEIRRLSDTNIVDDIEFDEEYGFNTADDETLYNSRQAMKQFITKRKEITDKYFDYSKDEEFDRELQRNLAIIKNFEESNKYLPFEYKIQNAEYRRAYEWVYLNTYERFSKEDAKRIDWAYKTLRQGITSNAPNSLFRTYNQEINNILFYAKEDPNRKVVDEFGVFHPSRLTEEEIQKIKNITDRMNGLGKTVLGTGIETSTKAKLIKDIPSNLPIYYQSVYDQIFKKKNGIVSASDADEEREKAKIIAQINNLISKGVHYKTGEIHTKDLLENLTEDEFKELASLYQKLKSFDEKERTTRQFWKYITVTIDGKKYKRKVFIGTKLNVSRFKSEYQYFLTHIKGTNLEEAWKNIFIENIDKSIRNDGKLIPIPNFDIYGHLEISYDNSVIMKEDEIPAGLIDVEKTKAKRFINDSLEYVPIPEYYEAQEAAVDKDKWFEMNHTYDPVSHRIVPLRIWTELRAKEGGEIADKVRVPKDNRLQKDIKKEYSNRPEDGGKWNPNMLTYHQNYRTNEDGTTTPVGEYYNGNNLTDAEKNMIAFLKNAMLKFASTNGEINHTLRGYAPRQRKEDTVDAKWIVKQIFGLAGLEVHKYNEDFDLDVDFAHEHDIENFMMQLLKGEGTQQFEPIPERSIKYRDEAEYQEAVKKVKERNKEIAKKNLEIDNQLLSNNWIEVFSDALRLSIINDAKAKTKNSIFLAIENLKHSKVYERSSITGDLMKSKKESTDSTNEYRKIAQVKNLELFQNWARRFLYNQYKKPNNLNEAAGLLQNIASAKYMILNITGGIANVNTGLVNILGEVFAKEYFDPENWANGQGHYFSALPNFFKDMWSTTSDNLTVAICKRLNIVDYDAMLERRPGEGLTEYNKRIQELAYGFLSGGEHYMQNSAMLAVLDSHRLMKDETGQTILGSIERFKSTYRFRALKKLLEIDKYRHLKPKFDDFIKETKRDKNKLRKYDEFRRDPIVDFIKEYYKQERYNQLLKDYKKFEKDELTNIEEKFNKCTKAYNLFTLENGIAVSKKDENGNDILSPELIAYLIGKSRKINNKIHGVYYKLGSAKIESEWWGSLVMQYHKHIYPGIMKRYRTRGYYNEIRETREKGSYVSVADFLSIEFQDFKDKRNKLAETNKESIYLASIQQIFKSIIDTFTNLSVNWELLPDYEKNNIRRTYADLCGIMASFLVAVGMHLACDDDELKEDSVKGNLLSTVIYLSDRLYSESRMYYPWGLYNEASVLYSSPIAATNGPEDLIKAMEVLTNTLFNEDYNPIYTTGLYKGQSKASVVLLRNVPGYRVYKRLSTMSKNNQYYRVNDNSLNMKAAKNIANVIKGE